MAREVEREVRVVGGREHALLEVLTRVDVVPVRGGEARPSTEGARGLDAAHPLVAQREDPVLPDLGEFVDVPGQGEAVSVGPFDVLAVQALVGGLGVREDDLLEGLDGRPARLAALLVHVPHERVAVDEAPVHGVLVVVAEEHDAPGGGVPGRPPGVRALHDDAPGGRLLRHRVRVVRVEAVLRVFHPAALHALGQGEEPVVRRLVHDDRAVRQDARALEEGREPLVEPAARVGGEGYVLVRGLVEERAHHAGEATLGDVALDVTAGEVASGPLHGRTDALLEILVAILEDVHRDAGHGPAVFGRAVAEELLVERRHLLHGLCGPDEDLVAGVGDGEVVVSLSARCLFHVSCAASCSAIHSSVTSAKRSTGFASAARLGSGAEAMRSTAALAASFSGFRRGPPSTRGWRRVGGPPSRRLPRPSRSAERSPRGARAARARWGLAR